MATNIQKIISNLLSFYNFNDKTTITVGAGGGQLVEYGRYSKKVIAIDFDKTSLQKLKENLVKMGLDDKFHLVHSDFYQTAHTGDVLMFEFCLHEMIDPKAAIEHALTMAPNILVTDHWTESEWAYYIDEEEKVRKSWSAINTFDIKKLQRFDTIQFFKDYDEIYQKVKSQGENSIKRIERFKNQTNFEIPMSYGFALI